MAMKFKLVLYTVCLSTSFSSKGEVVIPRETKLPRDYEVLDLVLQRGDAVELARLLSVSPQLVQAWITR